MFLNSACNYSNQSCPQFLPFLPCRFHFCALSLVPSLSPNTLLQGSVSINSFSMPICFTFLYHQLQKKIYFPCSCVPSVMCSCLWLRNGHYLTWIKVCVCPHYIINSRLAKIGYFKFLSPTTATTVYHTSWMLNTHLLNLLLNSSSIFSYVQFFDWVVPWGKLICTKWDMFQPLTLLL